jgi:3-oxoacyl-[acyl-carrier protein] reductase
MARERGRGEGARGAEGVVVDYALLATELGPKGIRVNAICLGAADTDMNDEMNDAQREQMKKQTALGRLGTTEEIADAAAFLASDDAG